METVRGFGITRTRYVRYRADGKYTKWDFQSPAQMQALANTPFLDSEGGPGKCSRCGTTLPTEAAFAQHFVIPDIRYLGLGDCPNA